MDQNSPPDKGLLENTNSSKSDALILDVKKVPNALLSRLIGEVKHENRNNISAYNRTHNRHNRGR